ncbi:MAG: hypothetical protein OHK0048_16350 [Rhodoferax sp.]
MGGFLRPGWLGWVVALLALPSSWAQGVAAGSESLIQAFDRVYANPSDLDGRYAYAQRQSQAGNFEAAIAALESVLVSPDGPASARVELGILYFRLGSYAMAESYLRQAVADPNLDERLRSQALDLLPEAARRHAKVQWSGRLAVGMRWRDNPLDVPAGSTVLVQGAPQPVPPGLRHSGVDRLVWGRVDHIYDLDRQDEMRIETGVAMAISDVRRPAHPGPVLRADDTLELQARVGLRFKPSAQKHPAWDIKPFVGMGQQSLEGSRSYTNRGAGVEARWKPRDGLELKTTASMVRFDYADRAVAPRAALESGWQRKLSVDLARELAAGHYLSASLAWTDKSARDPALAHAGPQLRVAYATTYPDPTGWSDRHWTTSAEMMVWRRRYRQDDPRVATGLVREDTERKLSLLTTVPVGRNWSVQLQWDVSSNRSNVPNYTHDNRSAYVNALWQF